MHNIAKKESTLCFLNSTIMDCPVYTHCLGHLLGHKPHSLEPLLKLSRTFASGREGIKVFDAILSGEIILVTKIVADYVHY